MYVNYSLGMGGIETLILELCRRLDPERYAPSVCVFQKDGRLRGEFEALGIPVYTIEKGRGTDWSIPLKLARLARQKGVDILHTHNSCAWFYGGIAAWLSRLPLIHTEHTSPDHNFERWWKIERFLSRFTVGITTVAASVARFMIDQEHIAPEKIDVIYNGIEPGVYEIQLDRNWKRKELGLERADLAVGMVARFFPEKDHRCLLEAFTQVVKRIPHARLLIAGDGPLREKLVRYREELGLSDRVFFLGNRRDIPELLQALDLFVLSSYKEGLPIVLLEAMAAGRAVVATEVDGNPELVLHNRTGLVVPPKNPWALAEAICELLLDPERARRMGEEGKRRVGEKFSFIPMISAYESLYKSVKDKRRKA